MLLGSIYRCESGKLQFTVNINLGLRLQ